MNAALSRRGFSLGCQGEWRVEPPLVDLVLVLYHWPTGEGFFFITAGLHVCWSAVTGSMFASPRTGDWRLTLHHAIISVQRAVKEWPASPSAGDILAWFSPASWLPPEFPCTPTDGAFVASAPAAVESGRTVQCGSRKADAVLPEGRPRPADLASRPTASDDEGGAEATEAALRAAERAAEEAAKKAKRAREAMGAEMPAGAEEGSKELRVRGSGVAPMKHGACTAAARAKENMCAASLESKLVVEVTEASEKEGRQETEEETATLCRNMAAEREVRDRESPPRDPARSKETGRTRAQSAEEALAKQQEMEAVHAHLVEEARSAKEALKNMTQNWQEESRRNVRQKKIIASLKTDIKMAHAKQQVLDTTKQNDASTVHFERLRQHVAAAEEELCEAAEEVRRARARTEAQLRARPATLRWTQNASMAGPDRTATEAAAMPAGPVRGERRAAAEEGAAPERPGAEREGVGSGMFQFLCI